MEHFCYVHAEVPAVGTCETCKRPICGQCVIHQQGSIFCSADCAGAHKKQAEKLHKDLIKDRRRRVSWGARIVLLLVAALIVVVVLEYLGITDYASFIPFEFGAP